MHTITLRTPADLPDVVAAFLGFEPSDSLVVVSIGGGPTARVDLYDTSLPAMMDALSSAAPHWTSGVLLVVYPGILGADLAEIEDAFTAAMPGVPLLAPVIVVSGDDITSANGGYWSRKSSNDPVLSAMSTRPDRTALVEEAQRETDPAQVWTLARESYLSGNGGRAWCYYDRYVELVGADERTALLDRLLRGGTNPRTLDSATMTALA